MSKHNHDHGLAAAVTYAALRDALVRPDDLADVTLQQIIFRCAAAAEKYPDEGGPAQAAENEVLRAYARYLTAVLHERAEVARKNGGKHHPDGRPEWTGKQARGPHDDP